MIKKIELEITVQTKNCIDKMEGIWACSSSASKAPVVIIYRHISGEYRIVILHVDTALRQAIPVTFRIEETEQGYFFGVQDMDGQQLGLFSDDAPRQDGNDPEMFETEYTLVMSRYGEYKQLNTNYL